MKTTRTIDFVDNATTKEAAVYAARYSYVFYRNIWRGINKFAHNYPWACIGIVVAVAVVINMVKLSDARAERDSAQKKQAQLQEQVEQLSCVVGARKEIQR